MELSEKIRLSNQIVALMRAEKATGDEMYEVVRLARWSVEAMQAEAAQAQELLSTPRHSAS